MVWGCFARDTARNLFRIQLNQHDYHSILQQYFWFGFSGTIICFNRTMTQHTSRLSKGYLTKKESHGVLHQITWSPQFPDLKQTEMVWDESDHRVKEKQPTGAHHMWELFQVCWKSIPGEAVIKAVIKAKGGYFTFLVTS